MSPRVALPTVLAVIFLAWATWATWLRQQPAATAALPAGAAAAQAGSPGHGTVVAARPGGRLGPLLATRDGLPLYRFAQDRRGSGASTCSGACAALWPPLTTSAAPRAAAGVAAGRLSTIRRADGGTQVAYDGWPLYAYAADHAGGPATGQGLDQFGARWYVVAPSLGSPARRAGS